nr:hypothetical protein GCM10020092_101840 [Actinoplanes digitatis]
MPEVAAKAKQGPTKGGIEWQRDHMRRTVALVAALITAMVGASAGPAGAAPKSSYTFLHPGGQPRLAEKVPVNVVFLGYEPNEVGKAAYLSGLPRAYEPVVRSRLIYGQTEKLGIRYTYDYRVTYANRSYEDKFFKRLGALATPAPLTAFQTAYNEQAKNVKDITSNNFIDAPSVEKWLATHPPSRRRHPAQHRLLHQLVRPRGLQVPRLHQDRRAGPRHRVRLRQAAGQPQDHRLGRHHRRRRGDRPRQHPAGLVPRPLRRSRVVDQQLRRRQPGPGRRRRRRLPHAAELGVHGGRLPVAVGAGRATSR